MTPSVTYRSLLVASIAVPLVACSIELSGLIRLAPPLDDVVVQRDEADLTTSDSVFLGFAFPFIIAAVWNWISLYRFRPSARRWAIWITALALALMPFSGDQVQTWVVTCGDYVGSLCFGAVLIAGYCEPFRSLFDHFDSPRG